MTDNYLHGHSTMTPTLTYTNTMSDQGYVFMTTPDIGETVSLYTNDLSYVPFHEDESGDIYCYVPANNAPDLDDEQFYFRLYIQISNSLNSSKVYYDYYNTNCLYLPSVSELTFVNGLSKSYCYSILQHFVIPFESSGITNASGFILSHTLFDPSIALLRNSFIVDSYMNFINSVKPFEESPYYNVTDNFSLTLSHNMLNDSSKNIVYSSELKESLSLGEVAAASPKIAKKMKDFLQFKTEVSTNELALKNFLNEIMSTEQSIDLSVSSQQNSELCNYSTYDNEDGKHISSEYKYANTIPGLVTCSHPTFKNKVVPCSFYNNEASCSMHKLKTETIETSTINSNSEETYTIDLVKIITKDSSSRYKILNTKTQDHTHSFDVPEVDTDGNIVDPDTHAKEVYQEVLASYDHTTPDPEISSNKSSSYIMSIVG